MKTHRADTKDCEVRFLMDVNILTDAGYMSNSDVDK